MAYEEERFYNVGRKPDGAVVWSPEFATQERAETYAEIAAAGPEPVSPLATVCVTFYTVTNSAGQLELHTDGPQVMHVYAPQPGGRV